jgi:AcrR family transcriptional regulator
VNSLSPAEVARRLGVQPPSLYKYFDRMIYLRSSNSTAALRLVTPSLRKMAAT